VLKCIIAGLDSREVSTLGYGPCSTPPKLQTHLPQRKSEKDCRYLLYNTIIYLRVSTRLQDAVEGKEKE